jgi:hypothetical protein
MRGEVCSPCALGDVAARQPELLPLDVGDDQAEAGPGIEPSVEEPQLGRARRELEEAEVQLGGGELPTTSCDAP